jgi:hypothetical protein
MDRQSEGASGVDEHALTVELLDERLAVADRAPRLILYQQL